jgi:hypothetical protein
VRIDVGGPSRATTSSSPIPGCTRAQFAACSLGRDARRRARARARARGGTLARLGAGPASAAFERVEPARLRLDRAPQVAQVLLELRDLEDVRLRADRNRRECDGERDGHCDRGRTNRRGNRRHPGHSVVAARPRAAAR